MSFSDALVGSAALQLINELQKGRLAEELSADTLAARAEVSRAHFRRF
ncbi:MULTISPECIES: hypothetical protein [unclassified Pseudomonas]|jgi:transcriptional regulator GlxA family with amidase domain|nr:MULTISPECIES: hypothetical protein [unclassified Pseudomonas]